MRGDTGTLSAFMAIVTVALLVSAGLVLDGGRLLAARRRAADLAGNAARAGAQALDEDALRSGRAVIDPVAGRDAVAAHLAGTAAGWDARVAGDTIAVDVDVRTGMLLLGIVGVGDQTVTATRRVRAATGVTDGGP